MKRIFSLLLIGGTFLYSCDTTDKPNSTSPDPQIRNDSMAASRDSLRTDNSSAPRTDSINDNEFATEAASGGLMEVTLGKFAQTNASNSSVKSFGNMMITDHSKANDELKPIARSANITLPTAMMSMHQAHIDHLKSLKGAAFDKAYMSMMVDDHNEDIEKFKRASETARDSDIRNFASKTLPVLQKHLDSAKAINSRLQ